MNIFTITKGSTKFTEDQTTVLMDVLHRYSQTEDGKWLQEIDYTNVVYKWSPAMENSYVMAAKPLFGNSILVCPSGGNPAYWVSLTTPAIVHELRHLWQRKRNTVRYALWSLASRLVLIFSEDLYMAVPTEKDAFDQQDKVSEFIGGI